MTDTKLSTAWLEPRDDDADWLADGLSSALDCRNELAREVMWENDDATADEMVTWAREVARLSRVIAAKMEGGGDEKHLATSTAYNCRSI